MLEIEFVQIVFREVAAYKDNNWFYFHGSESIILDKDNRCNLKNFKGSCH